MRRSPSAPPRATRCPACSGTETERIAASRRSLRCRGCNVAFEPLAVVTEPPRASQRDLFEE